MPEIYPSRMVIQVTKGAEGLFQRRENESSSLGRLVTHYGVQEVKPLFDMGRGNFSLKRQLGMDRVYILVLPPTVDTAAALNAFQSDPQVVYAEMDVIGYGSRKPDDPMFNDGDQWGLHNTGQHGGKEDADIDAPDAWGITTGSSSTVLAVIDTGIDYSHPEFDGKTVSGYDFVNGDNNPQDDHAHGSHVAGIMAAKTDNGVGVAGVCWRCKIMPLKGLNSGNWGYLSYWAEAVEYAVDHGADAINMSMGSTTGLKALKDAVSYAHSSGVPVVAAMMNNGGEYVHYPAAYPKTIAVGATNRYDSRYIWSNYGDHIDLVAPGEAIWSTWLSSTGYDYAVISGTSMATPHVTGVLGLIHKLSPHFSVEELRSILRSTAEDRVGPSGEDTRGWDPYFGSGRLNANAALEKAESYLLAGVMIGGAEIGFTGVPYAFTATVSPADARTPITYTWEAGGQTTQEHEGGISDQVQFTWGAGGTYTIMVAADNGYDSVSTTYTIQVEEPVSRLYYPLMFGQ